MRCLFSSKAVAKFFLTKNLGFTSRITRDPWNVGEKFVVCPNLINFTCICIKFNFPCALHGNSYSLFLENRASS